MLNLLFLIKNSIFNINREAYYGCTKRIQKRNKESSAKVLKRKTGRKEKQEEELQFKYPELLELKSCSYSSDSETILLEKERETKDGHS